MMHDTVEAVTELDEMQHDIARETLRYFDVRNDITVASVSDVLAKGSGLGSSSAFTVGLIKAINELKGEHGYLKYPTKRSIAEVACIIEMEKCGFPVGKQDQYAAVFGGFNLLEFNGDETVYVNKCVPAPCAREQLQDSLLLVYSGVGRKANSILQKQQRAMSNKKKFDVVKHNRDMAYEAYRDLRNGYPDRIGEAFNESWKLKKSLVKEISSNYFDTIISAAQLHGALGAKILGAGGGGFMLFYVKPERRQEVIEAITWGHLPTVVYDFTFVDHGTTVLLRD